MRRSRIFMTLRNQISAAAGIPQKRPEAIFRQPVARWITVATQFQSDLELLSGLLESLQRCESLFACARRSWRDPAGGSPVREGGSARPVASVAGSSATMVAKRTWRDDEDCIEPRKTLTVEAEALRTAAGNMGGTVMRGTVAPPGSETSSSRQGSCRNLGDLMPPATVLAVPGRFGKARSQSRIGRSEESDGCIVPAKPRTTLADRSG